MKRDKIIDSLSRFLHSKNVERFWINSFLNQFITILYGNSYFVTKVQKPKLEVFKLGSCTMVKSFTCEAIVELPDLGQTKDAVIEYIFNKKNHKISIKLN